MLIAAINKFTLLDYPWKLACIIFTAWCNFRCGFCHNSQFVLPDQINKLEGTFIPFDIFKKFLETRKNKLEAVVVSGWEPTIHNDLIQKIQEIKDMGFLVKLDTNGTNPKVIEELLNKKLIDFIAMDIKSSFSKWSEIVGVEIDEDEIKKSVSLIISSDINYEFRSTILPKYHDEKTILEMAQIIKWAKKWCLQNFRNKSVLDGNYKDYYWFTKEKLEKLKIECSKIIDEVEVRI